jgi:hypothetical protein
MATLNAERARAGLPLFEILPGAYDAIPAEQL